jgi:DNA helicase-2/ATP-dependent DNA helicase PcrA
VEAAPVALPSIEVLAGPDQLGRWVLVAPGQAAPAPWADAPRVQVDGNDGDVVEVLHRAWLGRKRAVVEVLDAPEPDVVSGEELYNLHPAFDLVGDRLHFLLRSAVDVRDPNQPRFWPAELAVAAGASVGTTTDIVLADGTAAWADGGPLQSDLVDAVTGTGGGSIALVSWVGLERGDLRPLRNGAVDADLAPDQLAAVGHPVGGARVIAPAGSGKTRVLTERARHLLRDRGVPASSVCLVAFNKRAAAEMAERTADLAGLQIRTLNALGYAICRGTGPFLTPPDGGGVSVANERDVRRLLEPLVQLRHRANTDPMAPWIEALGAVRLGMRHPEEVEDDMGGDVDGFATVYPQFMEKLAERQLVDFDAQIWRACELLLAHPDVRAAAQRSCRVLLVDEFQDLTPLHLLFVRLLGGPAFDIFGVGDDDQTIYGYTGASPEWLLDFAEFVPGSGQHPLQVNYRCAPGTITGATNLLSYNSARIDKAIVAGPGRAEPEGGGLRVIVNDDPTAATVGRVQELVAAGVAPSDIAVLTRVNATLAAVQVALADAGVAVVNAVDDRLLDRTGLRGALRWLRLVSGSGRFQPADISESARRPSRSLSPKVIEWMAEQQDINGLNRLARRLKDRDSEKVAGYVADLQRLSRAADRGGDTAALLTVIRDDIGLSSAVDTLDGAKRNVDRSTHGDDLAALISLARLQPDPASFEPWLRRHLEASGAAEGAGVVLATIHRVKGLEWPHVVVHEATVGLMPHRLSTDREEERRVFHVGITRSSLTTTVVGTAGAESPYLRQLERPRAPGEVMPDATAPQRPAASEAVVSRGKAAGAKAERPPVEGVDAELRETLRVWRLEQARREDIQAYRVFSNRTLDELAAASPTTLKALARIHGLGPVKLKAYGDDIIEVISGH